MVIELVAGRVVSRHLGSSLYTWTSVIGIVLAGIAIGNYIGGRLADRYRAQPTLATLFVLASFTCVAITILNQQVGEWVFLWGLPWPLRVGTHVAIVFLVPSLILGMISPVAAKMALDRSDETGRTIGTVYAWGVIGSIAGTFATGFYLIALFGTSAVIWGVAATLAVMAVLFGLGSWKSWGWSAVLCVLMLVGLGPWAWAESLGARLSLREVLGPEVIYVDESQYSHIRIRQVSQQPDARDMMLDKLLHSSIVMDEPTNLQYGYERIYAALTRELAAGREALRTLSIGGGGYVFPRDVQHVWPRSSNEVVEIDPAVTRAAVEAFGLQESHGIVVWHQDGRAFLRGVLEKRRRGEAGARYDFVYLDALNDYSVPYQLTTVDFLHQVHELLAPEGAILMNLIDVFDHGRFLGSMLETMEEVFEQVAVFKEGQPVGHQPRVRNTFVLVGSKRQAAFSRLIEGYDQPLGLYRLSAADLRALRAAPGTRVLTDDWAPVENLLAPVVKSSALEIAANVLGDRARERLRAGDAPGAVRNANRALGFFPGSERAHAVLADTYLAQEELDRAIRHYQESLRIRPSQLGLRINLAIALARRGRLADAERALEEVLQLDSTNASAHSNLGIVLMQLGRLDEAIASCQRAVQSNPRSADSRFNLGVALFRANRIEAAIAEFTQVLRIDPTNQKAREILQRARAALRSAP
jgi:tetratricopeptide (TPR) repeat protein/MFS family permease